MPNFDEELTTVRNTIPRLWWNIYQGCITAGFNELQSFILTQTYILGQNPYGIRPNDTSGPKTDKPDE